MYEFKHILFERGRGFGPHLFLLLALYSGIMPCCAQNKSRAGDLTGSATSKAKTHRFNDYSLVQGPVAKCWHFTPTDVARYKSKFLLY